MMYRRRYPSRFIVLALLLAVLAATATVNIAFNNTNDAPEFSSDTLDRSINENSAAGSNVGEPVTATDGNLDTLTYTLSGTDVASFTINGSSGQILVGQGVSLDHETKDSYSVTVTATDTSDATDTVTVNIAVNDVNEAPEFTTGPLSRSIDENSAAGTNVGVPVAATDEDTDTLTYTLGGVDASNFAIEGSTGQIQVDQDVSLDHETRDSYSVTVTATDTSDATDTVTVNIAVNDVNEAPEFPSATMSFSVFDNTPGGGNVGSRVTATDPDGDPPSYDLDGADAAAFTIGSSDGQLSVATGTTIGAAGSSYSFIITARDPSGATGTTSAIVNVALSVRPDLDGPPTRSFGAMLCMGFPGCPDSYLFLFPTLAVLGVSGLSWKMSRKGRGRLPNVYALLGVWGGSVLFTAVLVKANPLLAVAFIIVPVMVGVVWLAFGGARR